jgi:hypothetical protein
VSISYVDASLTLLLPAPDLVADHCHSADQPPSLTLRTNLPCWVIDHVHWCASAVLHVFVRCVCVCVCVNDMCMCECVCVRVCACVSIWAYVLSVALWPVADKCECSLLARIFAAFCDNTHASRHSSLSLSISTRPLCLGLGCVCVCVCVCKLFSPGRAWADRSARPRAHKSTRERPRQRLGTRAGVGTVLVRFGGCGAVVARLPGEYIRSMVLLSFIAFCTARAPPGQRAGPQSRGGHDCQY